MITTEASALYVLGSRTPQSSRWLAKITRLQNRSSAWRTLCTDLGRCRLWKRYRIERTDYGYAWCLLDFFLSLRWSSRSGDHWILTACFRPSGCKTFAFGVAWTQITHLDWFYDNRISDIAIKGDMQKRGYIITRIVNTQCEDEDIVYIWRYIVCASVFLSCI